MNTIANIARAAAAMEKGALDVVKGGVPSSMAAATLGRANPATLLNLMLSRRAYHSPHTKGRLTKHKQIAEDIEAGSGDALSNTVIRLGGGDMIDDMLWKKERGGEKLPWYKQLGGRVAHNPRTGPFSKLVGYPASFINSLSAPIARSDHYMPVTDAASIFMDEPAVTSHEVGHAVDFNTLGDENEETGEWEAKGKIPKSFLGRQGKGTLRDLYMGSRAIPGMPLWQEAQANIKSRKALVKSLKDNPERLREIIERRTEVLPAGYGSYAGGIAGGLLGGPAGGAVGALGGMAAGKITGLSTAKQKAYIDSVMRDHKPQHETASHDEAHPDKSHSDWSKGEKEDIKEDMEDELKAASDRRSNTVAQLGRMAARSIGT
jgi:hypothetical protein